LYDPVLQTGAGKGIAFVTAAGDSGNECFDGTGNVVGVGYPASDPNAIGVGGTETNLNVPDPINNPVAWNDNSCGSLGNAQCATGGGVSPHATIPPFQVGLTGEASTTHRNVPDVALPAEDVAIYDNSTWSAAAGTSWSSPQYAALMAEVYEYCNFAVSSATVSFDPVALPYAAYKSSPANFIDVTSGNNQFAGTTPFFSAGVGYDNVSGLGIPLGMPIAQALCPNRVPLSVGGGFMQQSQSFASLAPAGARTIDATPHIVGLVDQGARSASAMTRIQIVLRPTTSVAGDEATVVGALQRAGFTIVQRFADHLVVDAEAPASTVDAYFATSLHDVVEGNYGSRYTPVTTATLPAEIAPYVAGVSLDNLVTMHAR
ncbi:MAG: protease pro-enzyme activation domain-containing protein, partial [Candidatus Baltobacteraceae bacterium]